MKRFLCLAVSIALLPVAGALAAGSNALTTPVAGVLCDQYICADKDGISVALTQKYLGDEVADKLTAQGEFDTSEFTFANGVFCDTKEKACHIDRYFDADGKRSAVDPETTATLFAE